MRPLAYLTCNIFFFVAELSLCAQPAEVRWSRVPSNPQVTHIMRMSPTRDGALWISSSTQRAFGALSSTDGGYTWRGIDTAGYAFRGASIYGDLFATKSRRATWLDQTVELTDVYRSIDTGRTWTRIWQSFPTRGNVGVTAFEFDDGGFAYFGTSLWGLAQCCGEVYRVAHRSATIEQIQYSTDPGDGSIAAIAVGTPAYSGAYYKTDAGGRSGAIVRQGNIVVRDSFVTTSLFKTSTGALIASGRELHRAFETPQAGTDAYTYSNIGVQRSTDEGSTWTITLDSLFFGQIIAVKNGTLVARGDSSPTSGSSRWIWCSTDDGLSWQRCDAGLRAVRINAIASIGDALYAATDSGLYRSVNIPQLTPRVSRPMHLVPLRVPARYASVVSGDRSLWVPDGWGVQVFHAGGLVKPRFLAWDQDSVLHVADLGAARVFALGDRNRDGIADAPFVAADSVEAHDIKFFRGAMYAAEMTRILKLVDNDRDGYYESRSVFIDGLASGGHTTRTIVFDTVRNVVYVSVGSASNASRDSVQGVIFEYQLDGSNGRIFARGVRNAVGMTQSPFDGSLWATNNGQDWQGDDIPPEWISIVRDGGFYGYPIAYSDGRYFDFQVNDQYRRLLPITSKDSADVRSMTTPGATVTAHSAPMAIEFANPGMPDGYRSGAFVALHGSWNRTMPTGNTIVYLDFESPGDSIATSVSYVMSGDSSESNSRVWWMRPCGLESDSHGNIYFTSDRDEMPLIGILYPQRLPGAAAVGATHVDDLNVIPNPTSASTLIVIDVRDAGEYVIALYDGLGQRVALIGDGWIDPGSHRYELDTQSLASGPYQLRVFSSKHAFQRRIVVQH